MKKSNINKLKGFTLLEAVIVMLILSLLVGIAVPSFRTTMQNSRLNREADNLYRIFNLARQEALSSGQKAMVCKSTDNPVNPDLPRCATVNSNSWDYGLLAYRANSDVIFPTPNARLGNYRINHATFTSVTTLDERKQLVLRSYDYNDNGVNFVASADQRVIAFDSNGAMDNEANGVIPFRIAICDERGEVNGKYIEINAIGRISQRNTSEAGGVDCDGLDN